MRDPKRLLADGPTEIERTILRAASRETPSPDQRARVRGALGLAPGARPAGSSFRLLARAAFLALFALIAVCALCAAAVAVR